MSVEDTDKLPRNEPDELPGAAPAGPAEARETEQESVQEGHRSCPVVGIGASAGGLEALEELFRHMPPDPGAAFVVVQHLDPNHPSIMAELLERVTSMPVRQAVDGMEIEPDHVYLIPPNAVLTMEGQSLHVVARTPASRAPIDTFFRSVAEVQNGNCICVVLSGAGSDGTLGLKAVKERGGIAMAQALDSARFNDMPRSAIALGLVDQVLPTDKLGPRIVDYVRRLKGLSPNGDGASGAPAIETELQKICSLLQRKTGNDFSRYKRTTLIRRIQRRMHVVQAATVTEYVEELVKAPAEAEQLFKDLLISVTHFFRDPEAFESLAREVVPRLVKDRSAAAPVRIWAPGCASGEEAYSLAMILREGAGLGGPPAKIFATDIDDRALEVARVGGYPIGIADQVSPERLERFFTKQDTGYTVRKELRDMCVFSTHNLISDPPFSNLDMIVCRNVLIYLESELQKNLFPIFHYALRAGGYLFLGPSESTGAFPDLFKTLDKKNRIFQRRDAVVPVSFPTSGLRRLDRPTAQLPREGTTREQDFSRTIERSLLDRYGPAAVVINRSGEIVFVSGRTARFLELQPGLTSVNIMDMTRKELRPELHNALHRVTRTREEIVQRGMSLEIGGRMQRLDFIVRPLSEIGPDSDLFLVVFQDVGPAMSEEQAAELGLKPQAGDGLAQLLEAELRSTREHLQTTIEELETSNEELKSTNEELMSTNEELQSANEEMQTSREELQSINEELQTVNSELSRKVDELDKANSDLQNLFASTYIATVFLDHALHIKKFSPAAKDVFRLIDSDVGRPITDIAAAFADGELTTEIQQVLVTLQPSERQVKRSDGDVWYLRRILPYQSTEHVIDGVVITFVDITELKSAQERASRLADIVEASRDAIIGLTPDARVTSWNVGAEEIFGYSAGAAAGRPLAALLQGAAADVGERVRRGERVAPFESTHRRADGREVRVVFSASPLVGSGGETAGGSVIAHDVTEHEAARQALRESEERFRQVSETSIVSIAFYGPSGAFTEANGAFLKMTGQGLETLRAGRLRWQELLAPEWQERGAGIFAEIDANGRCEPREVQCVRGDGARFWALLGGARLKGGTEGVVLLFDITEQKQAEEALVAADQRKNEFLATLAHELRNPLAPIRNGLHVLLRSPPGDPAAARALEIIERQVHHMARLIEDLLDVSRISNGKVLLRAEPVDLVEIVRATVEDHRAEANAAGLVIAQNVPATPVWTVGDATRLSQSVGNLLNNAIKFTRAGDRVAVELEVAPGGQRAMIRVRDTGIGMSADTLSKAFELFTQAEPGSGRRGGGLGIGLALVRGMVELHGGTVKATSGGPGKGSELTIELPLKAPPEARAPEGLTTTATHRILVIEDNEDSAESLCMLLTFAGHEVERAADGPGGVALARSFRPDVVLCDIGLPAGMTGYDVARALRAEAATAGAYLIAVTGFGMDDDQRRAQDAGFDKHLTKPVDPTALESMIASIP